MGKQIRCNKSGYGVGPIYTDGACIHDFIIFCPPQNNYVGIKYDVIKAAVSRCVICVWCVYACNVIIYICRFPHRALNRPMEFTRDTYILLWWYVRHPESLTVESVVPRPVVSGRPVSPTHSTRTVSLSVMHIHW